MFANQVMEVQIAVNPCVTPVALTVARVLKIKKVIAIASALNLTPALLARISNAVITAPVMVIAPTGNVLARMTTLESSVIKKFAH